MSLMLSYTFLSDFWFLSDVEISSNSKLLVWKVKIGSSLLQRGYALLPSFPVPSLFNQNYFSDLDNGCATPVGSPWSWVYPVLGKEGGYDLMPTVKEGTQVKPYNSHNS